MNDRKECCGTLRPLLPVLILSLSLLASACVRTVAPPPLDVTFLPQRGDFISRDGERLAIREMVKMANDAEYILVGEGHRNIGDHKVQQALLAAFSDSGKPISLGLEMVAVDMRHILDDFGKGQVEVAALEEELQWKARWGYPFSLFSPLFEIARRNSVPVAGLNVPPSVTRKIGREGLGSLTDEERTFLPEQIVMPSMDQMPMLDKVFEQHGEPGEDDPARRDRFLLAQSVWDSRMAEQAVNLHRRYDWPVLVIAGAGHVEHGWGIARRIRLFDPGARILTVMPWRGGEFDSAEADVFFHSPDTYVSRMGMTISSTGRGGLLVEAVTRDSRADKAGIRPGDVLEQAGTVRLDQLMDLHRAGAEAHERNRELVFQIRRGCDAVVVNVGKLGEKK